MILTKNEIIEIQRYCYGKLEDVKVTQFDTEVTLKVGSMISEGSYFDIHKFARDIEAKIVEKLNEQKLIDHLAGTRSKRI